MGKSDSGLEIYGFAFAVVTLVNRLYVKCQKMPQSVASLRLALHSSFWLCKVSVSASAVASWKGSEFSLSPICPETSFCSGGTSAKLTCFVQVTPDTAPHFTCGTGAIPGLCLESAVQGLLLLSWRSPGVSCVVTKRIEDTVALS